MKFNLLTEQAANIKAHRLTIYFAAKNPEVPLLAKLFVLLIVAYALNPIDLISDSILIIGYLDDLAIVRLGLTLVFRLTPPLGDPNNYPSMMPSSVARR